MQNIARNLVSAAAAFNVGVLFPAPCHIPTAPSAPRQPGPKLPDFDAKVALVMSRLPRGAAHFAPKHVAPLLGISDNAFCKHCRNYSKLKNWKGSYRFEADDRRHIQLLEGVIRKVLTSGMKLPDELKWQAPERPATATPRVSHRAPQRVQ